MTDYEREALDELNISAEDLRMDENGEPLADEDVVAYKYLDVDGSVKALLLSADRNSLLIDNKFTPFKSFSENGGSYVELADGRKYLEVNELYA